MIKITKDLIKKTLNTLKVSKNYIYITNQYLTDFEIKDKITLHIERDLSNDEGEVQYEEIVNALIDDKLVKEDSFNDYYLDNFCDLKRYYYNSKNFKPNIYIASYIVYFEEIDHFTKEKELYNFFENTIKKVDEECFHQYDEIIRSIDSYKPKIFIKNRILYIS